MHELPIEYVNHLVSPRGLGDLPEPQAAGEIGSMVGGIGARFTLSYASDGGDGSLVADVRGRAFGTPALIAPISWLCSQVEGGSWQDAGRYGPAEIVNGLRGATPGAALPAAVERAAEFAASALRRALGIDLVGPADCRGPGILVCRCLGVGDRPIRAAIAAGRRDPESIGIATGACTGCRSCRPDLLMLIDEETLPLPPDPGHDRHPVERVALVHGARQLRGLGLPLLDARYEHGALHVRLGEPGPNAGIRLPGAIAQLRWVLRETVADDVRVLPRDA